MIKLNGHRTVRETKSEYQHTDAKTGEIQFDEIRVRYFSPRFNDLQELRTDLKARMDANPEGVFNMVGERLAKQLESLPDITDAKGKPIKINIETMNQIDLLNLQNISDAIDADIEAGKSRPSK